MVYENYVDLLKRAVSGYLFLDMDHTAVRFDIGKGGVVDPKTVSREQIENIRKEGQDWPGIGYSMCGHKRLDNLEHCLRTAVLNGVPGDFVEAGVWRGGASIFAAGVLRALGQAHRKVWVADSFKGLPPPDEETYPKDKGSRFHEFDYLAVPRVEVERAFDLFGLRSKNVRFIEGFFEQTMKSPPMEKLCVARLDGDMYSSTISCLEGLYPKISPGGFVIIDDYSIKQCKEAVTDFRTTRGIDAPIQMCDWTGAFWQVPPR